MALSPHHLRAQPGVAVPPTPLKPRTLPEEHSNSLTLTWTKPPRVRSGSKIRVSLRASWEQYIEVKPSSANTFSTPL